MTFISYAQNFEDVMLWRALKHIQNGFYIDVGAAWPDVDSVTKAFYDEGWRGINIEPNPEFNRKLSLDRPLDINLALAAGSSADTLTMNIFTSSGLSTFDHLIADKHRAAGFATSHVKVDVVPLEALWSQHVPAGQDVHFLKVDVEGFEEAVLKGNNWSKYRPWIVIVEATLPLSQEETYQSWEPTLLGADYYFAYADGLNRFYVAAEHAELLDSFKYPPNRFFDNFKLKTQLDAETRATMLENCQKAAEDRAKAAEDRAKAAEDRATKAECQIAQMINSTSWRITAPLRALFSNLRP